MTLLGPAIMLLFTAITRPACPHGSSTDVARAELVRALLASTPDGARLTSTAEGPAICFADGDGGLLASAAILPRDASAAAQAARFAHLWQHAIDRAPTTRPSARQTCVEWLAENERAEQRGDAVESRVASALKVTPAKAAVRQYECR